MADRRSGPGWLGRTPSDWFRVGLLAGSAVALIAVAVAAAQVGPWIGRQSTPEPLPSFTFDPTLPSLPTLPTLPTPSPPSGGFSGSPTWILVVLGVVLVLAVAAMALAWWRERNRRSAAADHSPTPPHPQPMPTAPGGDLPFDARLAADYVIQCWQRVEAAAADAGVPRRSEQTPTEFLASIDAAHPTDPAAAAELLRLYHHARFDHVALRPDSAELARSSTRTLLASLPTATMEYR